MKLNTILKISAPMAMIGVITPIITSCSGTPFDFVYGDDINCLQDEGKEGIPYHTIEDVQKAVKNHVNRETTKSEVSIASIKSSLSTSSSAFQNCYFDLIAAISIGTTEDAAGIKISDWNASFTSQTFSFTISFIDSDTQIKTLNINDFTYERYSGEKVLIEITDGSVTRSWQSYTYKDCKAID